MKKLLVVFVFLSILTSCGESKQSNNIETAHQETTESGFKNLDQDQAKPLLDDPEVITIDVRTPAEIEKGYIAGADMFIDLFGDFRNEIKQLDPNKTYLIYCASGGRSEDACNKMVEMGFLDVENLLGGIENWTGEIVQ